MAIIYNKSKENKIPTKELVKKLLIKLKSDTPSLNKVLSDVNLVSQQYFYECVVRSLFKDNAILLQKWLRFGDSIRSEKENKVDIVGLYQSIQNISNLTRISCFEIFNNELLFDWTVVDIMLLGIGCTKNNCPKSWDDFCSHQQISYTLQEFSVNGESYSDFKLIEHLNEFIQEQGFSDAKLPPILISFEAPPLFDKTPKIKNIFSSEDKPENINIEDLLGFYRPAKQEIIIYFQGILWMCVNEGKYNYKFRPEWLAAVVMVHEIGHWMTHQLVKPGKQPWNLDLYNSASTEVHEGLAQLITYWVAKEVCGEFKSHFEELNKQQSSTYHVFDQFTNCKENDILESLEKLRVLSSPATLNDWKSILGVKT